MDEREALARLVAWLDVLNPAPNSTAWATADRILAAGYRLPTTGEIAAERRGWEQGRDAAKEVARDHRPERPLASRCTAEAIERGISALTFPDQMQRDGLRPAEAATMDDYDRHRCRYCGGPRATLDYRRRCMDCGSDMPATVLAMHVDPDCWRLEYSHQPGMLTRRGNAIKAAIRILAAGYRLPTTGELDAERRGWEAAADALDHWGDQEDAAAVTGPEADVTVHRAREAAFYDAAARLRERRAPASPPPPRHAQGREGVMRTEGGDPIEDGQAECRFCGEWYHVGLLAVGHNCDAKREHDEIVRFTRPEALRGGKRIEPVFYDDEDPEFMESKNA